VYTISREKTNIIKLRSTVFREAVFDIFYHSLTRCRPLFIHFIPFIHVSARTSSIVRSIFTGSPSVLRMNIFPS